MKKKSGRMVLRGSSAILSMLVLFCGLLAAMDPAVAADYDIVILNGRVMDPETLYDGVANVAIKDGRIVEITKKAITGKETIDATGHVVAPGMVDTHFHSLDGLSMKMAARDRVNTGMDLEMRSAP